mgnify:CR=1 FL=1
MKVKELIEELKKYNQEAVLTVGDNFDNGIDIGYAGSDGCTEETCDFVCFDAQNNTENSYEDEQPIDKAFIDGYNTALNYAADWIEEYLGADNTIEDWYRDSKVLKNGREAFFKDMKKQL